MNCVFYFYNIQVKKNPFKSGEFLGVEMCN